MTFLQAIAALLTTPFPIAKVSPLHLKPGDVVVLQLRDILSERTKEHLHQITRKVWPDHKVVILDPAISHLTIVSPDHVDESSEEQP